MAKIALATFGSLGDLHPKIAIALELSRRGHDVSIAAMEFYREKIEALGLGFHPMGPHLDPNNADLAPGLMDQRTGSETLLKTIIMPGLRSMFDDLMSAAAGADLLVTGEVVFAAPSVVEKTSVKWVSTSLAPISFFSPHDPLVPPNAVWLEHLRFLGPAFHRGLYSLVRWSMQDWFEQYWQFRREIGLEPGGHPLFEGKFSPLLHLALFSRVLSAPQLDWPPQTIQTGFCFYDGHLELSQAPPELEGFLKSGEAPIVFTLGSAAVLDARDFFAQSAMAARKIGRRAVLIYGVFSEPPKDLDANVIAVDYAPYSQVFPRASCVVHQGGVGTTAQALRAGVPQLIMPFGHDQPDNAARCRRIGVAEVIDRDGYNSDAAAKALTKLLSEPLYTLDARRVRETVLADEGTEAACREIERVLRA